MSLSDSFKGPASALTLLSSLVLPPVKAEEPEFGANERQEVSHQVSAVLEASPLQIYNFQRVSADRCCFEWNGKIGKTYRVEISHDLKSWQTLPGGLLCLENPEDALCEVENLTGHPSCFFRVSEVLEPFISSSSALDAGDWLDYVSRFSQTLSFEDQQALLAGTFTFSSDPDLEISVADKQAETEARIADFPQERARLVAQDKYGVQQHNQRIYEQAAIAALNQWFPNQNYGADKVSYLNTDPMRRSLEVEIYNRGGYRKEKDNNYWNQYFQDLEQELWKDFEQYKKEKEASVWKKHQTTPLQEIDFDCSLEELFPVTYEINDSNRARFAQYVQDVFASVESGIVVASLDVEILQAREALLLHPEFLQKEIERLRTQIAADFQALEHRISNAANAETARTGEPKRWIVARLWTRPPYASEKAALDKKSWVLNCLTHEFLTPDVFARAQEDRLHLARNHAEKKAEYLLLREHCLQRKAFLEAQKILSPEDLDFRVLHICTHLQRTLEKKKTEDLPWTQDKEKIQNLLPTLTALRSWEDFLYNEFLGGSLNQSAQNISNAKQHFFSEQDRLMQQATNSYAHNQLNEYWGAILSSRTPFRADYEPTLRNLVYNAHNALVGAYENMAQTQYFVRNPMEVEAERDLCQNQLQILLKAEGMYFGVLEESIAELNNFWEARKNYTLELYLWLQKDPATRGAKPVFDFSLEELLETLEKRVNDALLRATVYGESHKNVAKKDLYGNPEETLAQLLGTMKYFDSPQGRAVTDFQHQQAFNQLLRPGGAFYEKYKHDERFVDPETGELISTLNIAKAESGMYPSLSVGRDPENSPLPLENPQPEDMEHLLGENFHSLSLEEQERRLSLALAAYNGEGLDLEKEEVVLTLEGLRNLEFRNAIERNIIAGRDPFSSIGYQPLVAGLELIFEDPDRVSINLREYGQRDQFWLYDLIMKNNSHFIPETWDHPNNTDRWIQKLHPEIRQRTAFLINTLEFHGIYMRINHDSIRTYNEQDRKYYATWWSDDLGLEDINNHNTSPKRQYQVFLDRGEWAKVKDRFSLSIQERFEHFLLHPVLGENLEDASLNFIQELNNIYILETDFFLPGPLDRSFIRDGGRTLWQTNAKAGESYHNYGLAIDLNPMQPDGSDYAYLSTNQWANVNLIAQKFGFSGIEGDDKGHFEFRLYSIPKLQQMLFEQHGTISPDAIIPYIDFK